MDCICRGQAQIVNIVKLIKVFIDDVKMVSKVVKSTHGLPKQQNLPIHFRNSSVPLPLYHLIHSCL